MNSIKYILLVSMILHISCNGQVKSELEKTQEVVAEAIKNANSEESRTEREKIRNEKILTEQFVEKIESSGITNLIISKDTVLAVCENLFNELENSIQLLEAKHGRTHAGELKNKMEISHVNSIFIQDGKASEIKKELRQVVDQMIIICQKNNINMAKDDLPLKLKLFMEEEGKSWEEYFFQDMPAGPLLPLIEKYKIDIVLTKLLILEKLAKKA